MLAVLLHESRELLRRGGSRHHRLLVEEGDELRVAEQPHELGVEPVDERVAGAVTSIVEHDGIVAVGSSAALVGYRHDATWWAEPGNIDQVSIVAVDDGVLHAIGVLGGYQVVGLQVGAWDGELLEEPEVIAEGATIRRVAEGRFKVRGGPGQRRRGDVRFDVERAAWRMPSVYGV